MDATFKVPVAGEHRSDRQVAAVDRRRDRVWQRSGVADAGGAPVSDQVEAERVQILLKAAHRKIVGDHLRAGCKRGFHPWLDAEALPAGIARHQAGTDQNIGIRGVGAAGDRGDHHVAVGERVVGPRDRHRPIQFRDRARALLVHVGRGVRSVDVPFGRQVSFERGRGLRQGDPILWAFWTGKRRLDRTEIQLNGVGEHRIGRVGVAPQAL